MSTAASLTGTLPAASGGPIGLLLSAWRLIAVRVERLRLAEHLDGLDDRLLADMGIARRDIAKLIR